MAISTGLTSRGRSIREREGSYPWFLLATLLPILVTPFTNLEGNLVQRLLLPLVADFLVIQSLRIMPGRSPGLRLVGGRRFYAASAIYAGVVMWIPFLTGHHAPHDLHGPVLGGICLFYLMTAARIIQLLAHLEGVNWRSLCLGAAGYVQLGLTAGQFATFMAVMRPGSFNIGRMLPGEELVERLNYFAFVTLGSIGYGDVLPATPTAEFLAVFLSIAGTLYVSLVIGLLLSRYINDRVDQMVGAEINGLEDPSLEQDGQS